MTTKQKAIGVVRISVVGDRKREGRLQSDIDQEERIGGYCRDRFRLVDIFCEPDVSAHDPLEQRTGLYPAVQAVEEQRAKVIVFGDFDRAFRSLQVQGQAVRRIEAAGGQLHAVGFGRITEETTDDWAKGTMNGFMSEWQWRVGRDKSMRGQEQAIKKGKIPMRLITGLRRGKDGRVELSPKWAAVRDVYEWRLAGATLKEIRDRLRSEHGVKLSYTGVKSLLTSPQAKGEVVYRGHRFPAPAIVDPETWRRAQKIKMPRGRAPRSERLLARLGVLRCGSCDARMTVGMQTVGPKAAARGKGKLGAEYPFYRCGNPDCERGVTIAAPRAEDVVSEAVKEALVDVEGRASAEQHMREAAAALDRAQAEYERLIELLDPFEPAAAKRLEAAKGKRDAAQEHLDSLGGLSASVTITAAKDWDRLTLDERRALIRATVARATVRPGRGSDRISVELFGD
jgi:DNA invertase Pin-like site-specific DNA recombinase